VAFHISFLFFIFGFLLRHTRKIGAPEPPGNTTPKHAGTTTSKTVTTERPFPAERPFLKAMDGQRLSSGKIWPEPTHTDVGLRDPAENLDSAKNLAVQIWSSVSIQT
jgi:hypothetical protein